MTLAEKVRSFTWYHSIDLGNGIVTPGRFPELNLKAVTALLDQMDIQGADCLDIGTMDGKIAFNLEARGARSVTATCLTEHPTVHFLKEHFHSNLQYFPGISLDNIDTILDKTPGRFDLIVFSGVLYHLMDPLRGIAIVRNLLKPGGVMVLETGVATFPDERLNDQIMMVFNHDGRFLPGFENIWFPTPACVRYMMSFCCLRPLGHEMNTEGPTPRYAVAARAVASHEVETPDVWMKLVHAIGGCYQPLVPKRYDAEAGVEGLVKMPDTMAEIRRREPPEPPVVPGRHSRKQHEAILRFIDHFKRAAEKGITEALVYHPWKQRSILAPSLPRGFKFGLHFKGIVSLEEERDGTMAWGLPVLGPQRAMRDDRPILCLPEYRSELAQAGLEQKCPDLD